MIVALVALAALGALVVSSVALASERLGCREAAPGTSRWTLFRHHEAANREFLAIIKSGVRPWFTPPSLRASAGHLRLENRAARRDDLSRMRDVRTVARFRLARLLVPVPEQTDTYYVAGVAPALRVARPWTKRFITDLAEAYRRRSGTRLRITSLTRTIGHQGLLRLTNVNAAPARGRVRSTHLTGASVDISKRGLSDSDTAWLRAVLDGLHRRRLVHAVEEFRQPHFHVMVRRSYDRLEALPQRNGC
jgi:hypothetical protein